MGGESKVTTQNLLNERTYNKLCLIRLR